MRTTSPSVAVVATTLPSTDRRALSEAWYSALHVADRAPVARRTPAVPAAAYVRRNAVGNTRTASASHAQISGARADRAPQRAVRANAPHAAPLGVIHTRPTTLTRADAQAALLAQRIERALAARAAKPSASVALKLDDGRVHLLVRTTGASTRIIALCAPALRERVELALSHARFALARRGIAVEVGA